MSILGSVLGTVFKGILGGVSASAANKAKSKLSIAEIAAKGTEDRKSVMMASDLEEYNRIKKEQENIKGFENYKQFNSLNRFAPNYQEQNVAPVLPVKPTV